MSELRTSLGVGGAALLAIGCCAGLPLIAAAGFSVAALAWIGGIAVAAVGLAVAGVLLFIRVRTRRSCDIPATPTTRRSPL